MARDCYVCGAELYADEGLTWCQDCRSLRDRLQAIHGHDPQALPAAWRAEQERRIQAHAERVRREQ